MHTAEELGERKVIEEIWKQLDKLPDMPVPFGDDVSAIEGGDGGLIVVKTDMLVGRTDVPSQMSYWQAARKAVIMNISDFAAKGVEPLGLLASIGITRNMTTEDIKQIGKGLNAGTREYNSYVIGGDTNETDDLVISISLFGLAEKERLVLRSGARPGDVVATTGLFGLTSCGLRILSEGLFAPRKMEDLLVNSVLMPQARLKEGLALARAGTTTASIDSSDGLAWSLHELGRASNVGFIIETLPAAPEVEEFARLHSLNPLELSLYGGEEYELVVTIQPERWRKTKEIIEQQGGDLFKIGEATSQRRIMLKQNSSMIEIERRGYEHFTEGESC